MHGDVKYARSVSTELHTFYQSHARLPLDRNVSDRGCRAKPCPFALASIAQGLALIFTDRTTKFFAHYHVHNGGNDSSYDVIYLAPRQGL
jgi:hypothetical protein